MRISEADISLLTDDILEKLIFDGIYCESVPHCEAALVLGTSDPNVDRTPEAVFQYKNGACDKLIFSGGVEWDTEYGRISEAEYMRKYALENGVADSDIVLDNLAETTIENMIGGTLAINRSFEYVSDVKNLLIVTSKFHMKRSMLLANALLPRCVKSYPCPARNSVVTIENWRESKLGRRRVLAETGFIKAMVVNGLCDDIEL